MSTTAQHGEVPSHRPGEEVHPSVSKAGEEMKQPAEVTPTEKSTEAHPVVGTTEKEQPAEKQPQGLPEKEESTVEVTHEPLKVHGEKFPLSESGGGAAGGREIPVTDVAKEEKTHQPSQPSQLGVTGESGAEKTQKHEGSEQQKISGVSGGQPLGGTKAHETEPKKEASEGPEVIGLLKEGKGEPSESKPGHLVSEKVVAEHLMKHDEPAVVKGVEGRAPVDYEPPEKSESYHEREKNKPSP